MHTAQNLLALPLIILLPIMCAIQPAEAREQAKQKEMMRIGDEVVSPEFGKSFVNAQTCLDNNQFEEAAQLLKQFLRK